MGESKVSHFTATKEGRILDPDGRDYVAIGTNVNGNAMWGQKNGRESSSVRQDLELIADIWRFNTIRVVCTFQFDHPDVWKRTWHYDDIDAIVRDFTARKVVCVIEMHDYTGVYPLFEPGKVSEVGDSRPVSMYEFKDAWVKLALKYKDNPYVWLNIMNEPSHKNDKMPWVPAWRAFLKEKEGKEYPGEGYDLRLDADAYYYVHDYVIGAMRGAGIDNLIVLDENHYGQSAYDPEDPEGCGSACIFNAPRLSAKYGGLICSLHPYGWAKLDRMVSYAETMKRLGIAWIFGEYGPSWGDLTTHLSTMNVLTVSKRFNIGHMYWDWSNDPMAVVDRDLPGIVGGWGWEIDRKDGTKPTNLSWYGKLLWDDTRGQLKLPIPRFKFPMLVNGDFECGNLNPWFNIGRKLSLMKGESHDGSNCAQLLPGAGYSAQNLDYANFVPGKAYRLSAWGRCGNGAVGETQLGFGYKATGSDEEAKVAVLKFSSEEWERKEATFIIPEGAALTGARIYLHRLESDAVAGFFFDDVKVEDF